MAAPLNERIFVALDVPTALEALHLAGKLASSGVGFKIGPHFVWDDGFSALMTGLCNIENVVFGDLKHLDIPATVSATVASAARRGLNYVTVHSEPNTLRAAVDAAKNSTLNVLAVTVLSSFDESDAERFYGVPPQYSFCNRNVIQAHVENRVQWAIEAGCDGIVCSPLEVKAIRSLVSSPNFSIVVPGVRPLGYEGDDHSRVGTPKQALDDGADFLVIGRPIIRASDPVGAVCRIIEEMK